MNVDSSRLLVMDDFNFVSLGLELVRNSKPLRKYGLAQVIPGLTWLAKLYIWCSPQIRCVMIWVFSGFHYLCDGIHGITNLCRKERLLKQYILDISCSFLTVHGNFSLQSGRCCFYCRDLQLKHNIW